MLGTSIVVTVVVLILTVSAVRVTIAMPAHMSTDLRIPVGPGPDAFDSSELGIGTLVLLAVHSTRNLVLSIGTLDHPIAHQSSVDAGSLLPGAREQSRVALIRAPIRQVTGVCGDWFDAVAVVVVIPDPPLNGLLTVVPVGVVRLEAKGEVNHLRCLSAAMSTLS